ncbi:MAG: 2TM domain-containing protein [Bacteroidia bacterium]
MENLQDEILWKQAKKRVEFKKQLAMYLATNSFLWAVWFFTGSPYEQDNFIPWPAWCSLGWGIGLVFSFLSAYVFVNKTEAVEKEFRKLKERK